MGRVSTNPNGCYFYSAQSSNVKHSEMRLQQQEHEQAVFAAQNTPALQANFECLSPL